MSDNNEITFGRHAVIKAEDELLRARRARKVDAAFAEQLAANRFGIALSGGGIRSATINLGFLKTLNKFSILEQADYLSSVSGGGYTGAYVQAVLERTGDYDELFQEKHIAYMRDRGEYLFPGKGWYKVWNQFTLVVAYLVSLLMSFVSPGVVIALFAGVYWFGEALLDFDYARIGAISDVILQYGALVFGVVIAVHYLFNVVRVYNLYISAWYSRLEAALGLGVLLALGVAVALGFERFEAFDPEQLIVALFAALLIYVLGYFTNPNATSFHRFYRRQLADTFLHFAEDRKNVPLYELGRDPAAGEVPPYTLINATLNLQASKDPNFQGSKASDYFLLSPLFCGAKLTGYVPTETTTGYNRITLPSAVTISAAAINPGMGIYSSKPLSVLTTLFNLRLGFWVWNPLRLGDSWPVVWWPKYFFFELLGRIGTNNKMVNISDGGHIENLGVFELLRRRCRLILAVDAAADPLYTFGELENLTIRARNELGIDIRFREDQIPEDIIRSRPSHGYSLRRFAVADLFQIWDKVTDADGNEVIQHYEDNRVGTLVYIKSSVTAPPGRPEIAPEDWLKYGTYKYKIYHPEFPHESTADQFFDPIQWESYYQLGQWLAADVLGLENLDDRHERCARIVTIDELIDRFDQGTELFLPTDMDTDPATQVRGTDLKATYDQRRTAGRPEGFRM